jgi:hypothetical protein
VGPGTSEFDEAREGIPAPTGGLLSPDEVREPQRDKAGDGPSSVLDEESTGSEFDEAGKGVPAPTGGLLSPEQRRQAQRDKTRDGLAWVLVVILAVLVVVGCVGWLCYGDDTQRMQSFAILFGPVTTLLGAVLAFYFSSPDK